MGDCNNDDIIIIMLLFTGVFSAMHVINLNIYITKYLKMSIRNCLPIDRDTVLSLAPLANWTLLNHMLKLVRQS